METNMDNTVTYKQVLQLIEDIVSEIGTSADETQSALKWAGLLEAEDIIYRHWQNFCKEYFGRQ